MQQHPSRPFHSRGKIENSYAKDWERVCASMLFISPPNACHWHVLRLTNAIESCRMLGQKYKKIRVM